ncbi:MAG: single-stranded-DNA-specific exonuclease RecJ [Gammaproteobacteria bacterium]|nr:MAG: single-stranded-DNA-specific exonuclease RecJ [Gammaproteobacteria bacterium]
MSTRISRRDVKPVPEDLARAVHPVVARVLAARDVLSVSELDYGLDKLHPAAMLAGMDDAVALLVDALAHDKRILVVADYDADGATGCAVAVRGLRLLGAAQVDYLVPNRFEFGYGLTPEIVAVAEQRAPELLITVDNGISSVDGVAAAAARNVPVIVTDHHLPGERLPQAAAIVNPNQPGDNFPSKCLAGVGVAFYLLIALRAALRHRRWFDERGLQEPNLGQLLDLVALGTVADVVPLDANNRILVSQGIARIRGGRLQPGVAALLEVAGRDSSRLTASDLAFAVAPRLNAAGRLTDMTLGIECLLCDDPSLAAEMAETLDGLNRERRDIEARMRDQAMAQVEALSFESEEALPYGLCLLDDEWHPGVVGIVASRIKERLHRPVIAFAPDGEDALKGSARSVSGVHIRDALEAIATRHAGLLSKFGGHAMAAGLSLARERFDEFCAAFDAEVRRHLSAGDLRGTILSDGPLGAADIGLALARELRGAGPWGQGFPEPVFDGEFEVVSSRVVGDTHLKLTLRAADRAQPVDAIAFNALDYWPTDAKVVRLAYKLDVNRFRGRETAQLVVEHAETA